MLLRLLSLLLLLLFAMPRIFDADENDEPQPKRRRSALRREATAAAASSRVALPSEDEGPWAFACECGVSGWDGECICCPVSESDEHFGQ